MLLRPDPLPDCTPPADDRARSSRGATPRVAPRRRSPLRTAVTLTAVVLGIGGVTGLVQLPTGARPEVASFDAVVLPPLAPSETADRSVRAEADWNLRRAYSIARYLQRAIRDYTASSPESMASFPSDLTFVRADAGSTGPATISVLGAAPGRLYLAARAGDGMCAYLRDDRRADRVETVTVARSANCRALDAPPRGWQEVLVG